MAFGAELKAKRKELKISQPELAKIIGCSVNTIVRYERGRSVPSETKQAYILSKINQDHEGTPVDRAESLINEIARKRIEMAERDAGENRLLVPLLHRMGYEIVNEDDAFFVKNEQNHKCSRSMTIEELTGVLTDLKDCMILHLNKHILDHTEE